MPPEASLQTRISLMSGHRSRDLRRHQHLREGKGSDEEEVAGTTGLEPATSDVTGRRSNQLNYVPLGTTTSVV